MNTGDKISFVEGGETKTGTIIWIAIETIFIKMESGDVMNIEKSQIKQ